MKPSLKKGPHDLIPLNFQERTSKEVLTNAIIYQRSDDSKKLWENLKNFKNCHHTNENQIGYQYCESFGRQFPLIYKKMVGTKPQRFNIQKAVSNENKELIHDSENTTIIKEDENEYKPEVMLSRANIGNISKQTTGRTLKHNSSFSTQARKSVKIDSQFRVPLKNNLKYSKYESMNNTQRDTASYSTKKYTNKFDEVLDIKLSDALREDNNFIMIKTESFTSKKFTLSSRNLKNRGEVLSFRNNSIKNPIS